MSTLNLLAALVSLGLWVIFTFLRPAGLGIVHLLLGAGALLWMRWWSLRRTDDAG